MMLDRAFRTIRFLFKVLPMLSFGMLAVTTHAEDVLITSAVRWSNDKAQFFLSDGTYIRYDTAKQQEDAGYPQAITDSTWPGLGRYARKIAAACADPRNQKLYFFLNDGTYIQYDIATDRSDAGYPKAIDDSTWPGMAPYAGKIQHALNWPNNRIQFFLQDGQYIRYDLEGGRIDGNYPAAINGKTWPGLEAYADKLAGMGNWDGRKAIFFLNDGEYISYDIAADRADAGYPKKINN